MYNGIGLQSPRGSGTNGYVRRNLSGSVKPKDRDNLKKLSDAGGSSLRKLNNDIVEHDRKRKLEIKCLELQQMLEDQGYPDDEIEKRVSSYRLSLNEECMTSTAAKDKRKRTQKRETQDIAEERSRKNNSLRAGSFDGGSNFDPERRVKETAVERVKSLLVSSEEEEGEIAEEKSSRKSKKRSGKLSSPKTGDSKKRKKKKKKKKHKRKSKSESHRKHKSRHSHHGSKRDHRTKTPEPYSEAHSDRRSRDQRSQSQTRRRSQTPRASNHKAENKIRQPSKTTERYRSSTANERAETKRSESRGKRRSRTPEQSSSSEKRARHSEDGKRKRPASPKRSPSVENVRDSRPSKRHRRYSKTPEPDHRRIEVTSIELKGGGRSETPDKKSSKRGPHHSEDKAVCAPSSSSSEKFRAATSSKTFRKRYSSSPEVTHENHSRWATTKCAKKSEKPDRLNEKGVILRYSDSEVETDESEESAPKPMIMTLRENQNDHIANAIHARGEHQYSWKVKKPLSNPCSKSSSSSPVKFPSQRQPDVSNEVPKKAIRPERGTECVKETILANSVEQVPNEGRTLIEREKTSKGKVATEVVHRIKFEVTGVSLKKMVPRMGEKVVQLLPKNNVAVNAAKDPSSDRTLGKVEEAAESGETTLSAADMVDQAMKTTETALAANREKTLESLKKLLSHALPTDKESDTGSNSKSPHTERRSLSTRSSSRSSDSSHSSRSRDLSTSFKGSSSESSNCSRASSLSRRKRRRGSRKSKRESPRSRRRSSSKSSAGTSRSRSSRSRSCSSGEEEQKKKRRTTDRSSSSSSSGRSRSRSTSIPRRKGSPSFLERRRITSARRRPVPYPRSAVLYAQSPPRSTSYQSSSSSSCSGSPRSSGHDSNWESSYSLL